MNTTLRVILFCLLINPTLSLSQSHYNIIVDKKDTSITFKELYSTIMEHSVTCFNIKTIDKKMMTFDSYNELSSQHIASWLAPFNTSVVNFEKTREVGTMPPLAVEKATACEEATYVCSNQSFSGNSSGFGTQELNASNRGCLATNEHQSSWYYVTVQTGGTLQMLISSSNNQDDYDFALWGPYTEATAPANCPPVAVPLRCSYAGADYGFFSYAGDYYGVDNEGFLYWDGYNYTQVHPRTGMIPSYTHAVADFYYNWAGAPILNVTDVSEGVFGDGYVTPINTNAGDVYILLVDNWSSSSSPFSLTWGGTAVLGCTDPIILSVKLKDFFGNNSLGKNHLIWSTSSELNNDFFELERSEDGLIWQKIATIDGNGTTSESINYGYVDEHFRNVLNYYRLTQVDFDGTKETYQTISIDNRLESKELVKIVNTLGQEVDIDAKGLKLFVYSDGTIVKKMD